jgi:hypothetical protein
MDLKDSGDSILIPVKPELVKKGYKWSLHINNMKTPSTTIEDTTILIV